MVITLWLLARRPFPAHSGPLKGQGEGMVFFPFALLFVVFGLHHEVFTDVPHQFAHFAPVGTNLLTGRYSTVIADIDFVWSAFLTWNNCNIPIVSNIWVIANVSEAKTDFIVGRSAHNSAHINTITALFIGWSIQRCPTIWFALQNLALNPLNVHIVASRVMQQNETLPPHRK